MSLMGSANAKVGWRQRGYSDGVAGRPKSKLVGDEYKRDYLDAYKRGEQARAKASGK